MSENNRPDIIRHRVSSTGQPLILDNDIRGNIIDTSDVDKIYSLGLTDIDNSIINHIKSKIVVGVTSNDKQLTVPVVYADPEIAATISATGIIRDASGQVMYPVVAIGRTEIEKQRSIGNKLDANSSRNLIYYQQRFTKENSYNKFDLLRNRLPVAKYNVIAVPDYVKVTYECFVYTDYVTTNNIIIQNFMYASDSYWGDVPNRYNTIVSNIPTSTDLSNENGGRVILSQFTLTVFGFLLPDSIIRHLSSPMQTFSKAVITIDIEDNL